MILRSVMAAACLLALCLCSGPAWCAPDHNSYNIAAVTLKPFAPPPNARFNQVTPSFKEQSFSLNQAVNFSSTEQRLGGLSETQKAFLQQHRFALVPRAAALTGFSDMVFDEYTLIFDEMLWAFDMIGGDDDPLMRRPENAVFVGPDVFLQALHAYYSQRLMYLEKNELREALHTMLQGLYDNIKELRASASADADIHWQRLQAQIAVPLVLTENRAQLSAMEHIGNTDNSDTLARAMEIFAARRSDFKEDMASHIAEELKRIYQAAEHHPSLLGLSVHQSNEIDYTRFKPAGHYQDASSMRAYFRAMVWLSQIGWNLQTDQGLIDGLNFALAMSWQEKTSLLASWQRIMEISSFFTGYQQTPAYTQMQSFLNDYGATQFSAESCLDESLLKRLTNNLDQLPQPQTPFYTLRVKDHHTRLSVFPERFSVPWLISDQLTRNNEQQNLPNAFSALIVAAVMGNNFAESLLAGQVKVSAHPSISANLEGAPLAANGMMANGEQNLLALRGQIAFLSSKLRQESSANWYSSFASAWLRLLGYLGTDYGSGFPLYMQDPAFQAKQLETFMGGFASLKHDGALYEKPNFEELGSPPWDEGTLPPVPYGFVEPNLPFWQGLLQVVQYMKAGFKEYGLFPRDLEEFGNLTRFREAIELCLQLSEKELANQALTENDYEAIRTLRLHYMAEPYVLAVNSKWESMSALIVDVQHSSGDQAFVVYEALSAPQVMLVLVGDQANPRVVTGLAYNHREFITPYGARLNDDQWKSRVYGKDMANPDPDKGLPLPAKNFWYESLQP